MLGLGLQHRDTCQLGMDLTLRSHVCEGREKETETQRDTERDRETETETEICIVRWGKNGKLSPNIKFILKLNFC